MHLLSRIRLLKLCSIRDEVESSCLAGARSTCQGNQTVAVFRHRWRCEPSDQAIQSVLTVISVTIWSRSWHKCVAVKLVELIKHDACSESAEISNPKEVREMSILADAPRNVEETANHLLEISAFERQSGKIPDSCWGSWQ